MKVKAVKVNRAHYFLTDPRIYVFFFSLCVFFFFFYCLCHTVMKLTAMISHSKLCYLLQPYFLLLFHNYKILTTPNDHATLTRSKQFLIRSFHNHSYVCIFPRTHFSSTFFYTNISHHPN